MARKRFGAVAALLQRPREFDGRTAWHDARRGDAMANLIIGRLSTTSAAVHLRDDKRSSAARRSDPPAGPSPWLGSAGGTAMGDDRPSTRSFAVAGLARAVALIGLGGLLGTACTSPTEEEEATGGRVQGSAFTALRRDAPAAGRPILLPDVKMSLRRQPADEIVATTVTDLDGRYHFREQEPGTYRLCWEAPGFSPGCHEDPVVVKSSTRYPTQAELFPQRGTTAAFGVVSGRVTLRAGAAARYYDPFHGIDTFTSLRLVDGAGTEVRPAVRANSLGEFVFAGVPPVQGLRVRAEYAGLNGERPAAPQVDIELPNRTPQVVSVVAFDAGGKGVRRTAAGQAVELRASVRDADGDPLHFQWRAGGPGGTLLAADSGTVQWTVPGHRGKHSVFVLVHDGKGGYDQGEVTLQVGAEKAFFSGRVVGSDGAVLPGATVQVGGGEVATDPSGAFGLTVPFADRYVLNIEKRGYAPVSRLYDVPVTGRLYRLVKADVLMVDPTQPIVLEEPDRRECVDFEDLEAGRSYRVGQRFSSSGATIVLETFSLRDGRPARSGAARIDSQGRAGGSGRELGLNNITAAFVPARPLPDPTLAFGHYGGTLNLRINGDFVNVSDFAQVHGKRIGGVKVSVQKYAKTQQGRLSLTGVVRSFAVGGQELWIDDLCARRRMPHLEIPADSLADENGVLASGPLELARATIEPGSGEAPGDWGGLDQDGDEVNLLSYGVSFVEFRDAAGKLYNLAPGKTAELSMPIASNQLANPGAPPAAVPFWTYDMKTGFWAEETVEAQRVGDRYRAVVEHFSYKNTDLKLEEAACLAVTLDETLDGGAKELRATILTGDFAGQVFQFALDAENPHGIYRLPANETVRLEPIDGGGNVISVASQDTSSGPPLGPGESLWPPYPYEPCEPVTLGIEVPEWAGFPGSLFLTFEDKFVGSDAATNAYYDAVDPDDLRDTLGEWWDVNGFGPLDGSGGTRTAYFNNNDLALGRDMHCLQAGDDLACYVSNYADADEAYGLGGVPDKTLSPTTVTMEYRAVEGGVDRIVKFFVYDGAEADSPIKVSANLDGFGEKYVPQLCLICHGGTYDPADPLNPTAAEVDMGSSFREFDLGEPPAPDAVEVFLFPAAAPRAAQEASFKLQNLMVRDADAAREPIKELISRWYDDGAPDASPVRLADVAPNDWNAAPQDDLYLDVVAVSCRTCHIAQEQDDEVSEIDWDQYAPWVDRRAAITAFVCAAKFMPHSKVTYNKFWLDTIPVHRPSALGSFEDLPDWAAYGDCP